MPAPLREVHFDLDGLRTAAERVPLEQVPELLGALRSIEVRLLTRLYAAPAAPTVTPDRLLTVEEAADRMGCSADWLYRHWRCLPFARKFDFGLRFIESALTDYIRKIHP